MKVLMLGWELPPYNSGGLGIACYQLCKALSTHEVDIEFIVPYKADHDINFMRVTSASPTEDLELLKANFVYETVNLTPDNKARWSSFNEQHFLYEQSVVKLVESQHYDIIHAHDWLTFRAALKAKEKLGCPVILHVHSLESDRSGNKFGNPLVREIEEISFHLADRIIAISHHTKNVIIREYGIPADKIEVIHNSIDPGEFVPEAGPNAYHYIDIMKSNGYKVVVNVGRLTIQKGLTTLLHSFREVLDLRPKTLLLLVGSGEQYHELIELATNLGMGKEVIFADFQRGKNWRDAFSIGDVFIMPSVSEPFGLAPLEAIGYGTPVIVSKQSGVSEILNNCLKVDFWDTRETANKLIGVIDNNPLKDTLWLNSYREYEKLSWHKSSLKVKDLYERSVVGAAA